MSRSEAWDLLRLTRSNPPGRARTGSRSALYRAALQQSEDLMTTAVTTGRAARPLPLFYSVSQAGKAIEACYGVAESKGHGLHLDLRPSSSILRSSVTVTGGRFASVSKCLESKQPSAAVTLDALLASLPGLHGLRPEGARRRRHPARLVAAWHTDEIHRISGGNYVFLVTDRPIATKTDLHRYLSAFPTARKRLKGVPHVGENHDDSAAMTRSNGIECEQVQDSVWLTLLCYSNPRELDEAAPAYRGERWLRPGVLPGEAPPSPLMTWWLVLYALSMLARYYPVAWTRALDVNRSPVAVLLEGAMSEAVDVVPYLVLEAVQASPVPAFTP